MENNQRLALRPAEFAASVGMSPRFIHAEIKAGRLPARKAGRAVLIRATDGKRWLATRKPAA
jgi:excisionase family DNA binding protein